MLKYLHALLLAALALPVTGCVYVANMEVPAEAMQEEGDFLYLFADFGDGWQWIGTFDALEFCEDAMVGVKTRFPKAVLNCDNEAGETLSEFIGADFDEI